MTLPPDVDLHARPAAQFVRAAMGFHAQIAVAYEANATEANGTPPREVNAKSLLSVLSLGARRGTRLRLRAEGEDAALAVGALSECLAGLRE